MMYNATNTFDVIPETSILYNLLNLVCDKVEENDKVYYKFDSVSFKKGMMYNYIPEFIKTIKTYYNKSSLKFCERLGNEINYTKLITIFRQICKANNLQYKRDIVYFHRDYCIVYYIECITL